MTNPRIDPATLTETAEQQELRAVLREFFAAHSGPDLWKRMAGELELQGLAIPEQYGGSGYSFAELAVVLEESGRALCRAPLLSTVVLVGYALMRSGDAEACARYLPRIADGTLTATLVYDSDITAEQGAEGWILHGRADFVLDGAGAGLILVGVGDRLFACESEVERTPHRVLDETRGQAHLEFRGTAATAVGHLAIEEILDIGRAAVAAEQVGGIAHALDATVSYVGQRKQFGRPIGSFQAVKHRLAGLLVEYEAARSASAYATACVATDSPELGAAAAVSSLVCSNAYRLAVAEYVQLHGGTGFTWEHPAHLYVRRARSTEVLFGTSQDQALRLATALGVG
ncbi:acyl-CoA dehydrogenase [Kibdelosporangium banguiense]|uniref:Acyl-CoA dehydrogenase n=1 Tax=Kibdelosporangium banguiense TaxID=1365924 RepID=A0ABS4TNR8_9PSEU|nr:acyl-CoA dehydrogenase family protein [Kibdelosporangium banguiense]MBP2326050.1 acyl-CoA dehydrogenase [Kibdelosporangium banguiense]